MCSSVLLLTWLNVGEHEGGPEGEVGSESHSKWRGGLSFGLEVFRWYLCLIHAKQCRDEKKGSN